MAIPPKEQMTGNNTTEAQFKSGMNGIVDYLGEVDKQSLTFGTTAELKLAKAKVGQKAKALDTGKVWEWEGSDWEDTGEGELERANEHTDKKVSNLDSHRVNSGKSFPLLRKVRAGIDLGASSYMLNAILDVKVNGIRANSYYRIATIVNGNTSYENPNGIRIERCAASVFDTIDSTSVIHNHTSKIGLNIDYVVKGIQKFEIKCDNDDTIVEIILDVDRLPLYGTSISADASNRLGYNWIIDPSCYFDVAAQKDFTLKMLGADIAVSSANSMLVDAKSNYLKVNSGKLFPTKYAERDSTAGVAPNEILNACLIGARVINARKDYVYKLNSISNGANNRYTVNFVRIPVDRINSTYSNSLITSEHTHVELRPDRTKMGIQTFFLQCPDDPITELELTLDVDQMPPDGTSIITSRSTVPTDGYNYIIDPTCYEYADPFNFQNGDVFVEFTRASSKLKVSYLSGKKWFQMICARKSVNQTYGLLGFGSVDAYTKWGDLIPVQKTLIEPKIESNNDYHAPLVFKADSISDTVVRGTGATEGDEVKAFNGETLIGSTVADSRGKWFIWTDGFEVGVDLSVEINGKKSTVKVTAPEEIYTAGSHGTDGYEGGAQTAYQLDLMILVNNVPIDMTKDMKCVAQSVEAVVTNKVKAWNTVPSKRYCLEQRYTYKLSQFGLHIDCVYTATEDITLTRDGGCQHLLAGLTPIISNTIQFWGGKKEARKQMEALPFDTGPKSLHPDVFGVTTVFKGAIEMSSWVDVTYETGKREHLNDNDPLYNYPREIGKIYPKLFTTLTLKKGESYKWRGGYYFGEINTSNNYDNRRKTQAGWLLVGKDSSYTIV